VISRSQSTLVTLLALLAFLHLVSQSNQSKCILIRVFYLFFSSFKFI
jgi:hypothetical protein